MTLEEYLKKLEQLKLASQNAVIKQAPLLARLAYDLMRQLIDEGLDVQNGRLVPNEQALRTLNTFSDRYLGAFMEAKPYQGTVGQFLKNFKDVSTLMQDFQRTRGLDLRVARLGAVQELVISEIINRYSANGLNEGFVQPLRQLLFENVSSGTSKLDAMNRLREFIAGGKDTTGKLGRYLEQTAQQAVDSYTGAINTRIVQTFQIDTYIMSGSLIATSSQQCRYAIEKLDGIIERSDWPKLKAMAEKDGLVKGTTFETLPFNRLHWGCRHEFTPGVLTPAQKQALRANSVNN